MAAIGCLASPTYYSGQDISAIGKKHQHNVAQALFAGFRFRNFSPAIRTASRRLGANGASRFWYDATMQNCPDSAAERPDTALHRARTRRWASVRLLGTLCKCPTKAVLQGLGLGWAINGVLAM